MKNLLANRTPAEAVEALRALIDQPWCEVCTYQGDDEDGGEVIAAWLDDEGRVNVTIASAIHQRTLTDHPERPLEVVLED